MSVFHHSSSPFAMYALVFFARLCLCSRWTLASSFRSLERTKVKAIYRSFEWRRGLNGCMPNRAAAAAFHFRTSARLSSSVTESDGKTWRRRTSRRTNSFEVASQERRDGAKEGILKRNRRGGKKQYRTVFMSQGLFSFVCFLCFTDAAPPLLQYNWTKTHKKSFFFPDHMKTRNKISDETSVWLLLQLLLMGVCIHPSIHRSSHSSIHPITM